MEEAHWVTLFFFPRNVGMGSMAAFDQAGASIAPFVVLLVRDIDLLIPNVA